MRHCGIPRLRAIYWLSVRPVPATGTRPIRTIPALLEVLQLDGGHAHQETGTFLLCRVLPRDSSHTSSTICTRCLDSVCAFHSCLAGTGNQRGGEHRYQTTAPPPWRKTGPNTP